MPNLLPYALRQEIRSWPGVLALQLRVIRPRAANQLVRGVTALCLEGFPRSGNGFAYTCVRDVLGVPPSQIGHHTHSIANARRAVRSGIPAYVLVREPVGACASLLLWGASDSAEDALSAYAAYHRALLPLLDGVTIVPFDVLTTDVRPFLQRVAGDLGLPAPEWNDAIAASVQRTIERSDEARRVSGYLRTSLPDAAKTARKAELEKAVLASPRLAVGRRLHEQVMASAPHLLGRDSAPALTLEP